MSKRTTILLVLLMVGVLVGSGYVYVASVMPIQNLTVDDTVVWLKERTLREITVSLITLLLFIGSFNDTWDFIGKIWRTLGFKSGEENTQQIQQIDSSRERENFLRKMQTHWIEGKLYNSLERKIHLQLKMAEDLSVTSFDNRFRDTANRVITDSIDQVFHTRGRSLLILGEPGSGKTTTLLTLGESLIKDALAAPDQGQIPIIINLSSWGRDQKPLPDWIADELERTMNTPTALTNARLADKKVILLLDGLDEVAETARPACVEAINTYQKASGIEMVVTCREEEFMDLAQLNVQYAIRLQPFTPDEIVRQLDKYPTDLHGVRIAVLLPKSNWATVLQTPLTIGMASVALAGVSFDALTEETNQDGKDRPTIHRNTLFHRYVQHMLLYHRPLKNTPYTPAKTLRWLGNLANRMNTHNQTSFHIEWLQPTWLDNKKRIYKTANALTDGLSASIIVGLIFSWRHGLAFGLTFGILYVLVYGRMYGLSSNISLYEQVRWRWSISQWKQSVKWKANLFFGLIIGLILGAIYGLGENSYNAVFLYSLIGGIVGGALNFVDGTPSPLQLESAMRETPNWGVFNSAKRGLRASLILGLIFSVIFDWRMGLSSSLIYILSGRGGGAVTSHYILRGVLRRQQTLPLKLVSFLDTMADRILLRRVGGGWQFVHRYLQDYFATLTDEEIERIVNGQ